MPSRSLDASLTRMPGDPNCGYITPADVQAAIENAIAHTGASVTQSTLDLVVAELRREIGVVDDRPRLQSLVLNSANEIVATMTDGATWALRLPAPPAPYDDSQLRQADALLDQRITQNSNDIAAIGTGGGTGSPPYDDTAIKADIAQNTANIGAVAQASLQGDAGLDTRVTALEGAPVPTFDADDIAETATRVWVTPAEKAAIGTSGGTGSPPYDDTVVKADIATNKAGLAAEVTARTQADTALDARITAIPAPTPPYDDTALSASVAANTQAIAAIPAAYDDTALTGRVVTLEAGPGHWFGSTADYNLIAQPDPNVIYVLTS